MPQSLIERYLPHFVLLLYLVAATIGALQGGLWASLGIGGGIVLLIAVWAAQKKFPKPPNDLASMAGAFLLAVAAMNFQSSQPGLSWQEWAKLAGIFVPLLFLLSPPIVARIGHPKLFVFLPIAAVLGGLTLALKLYFSGAVNADFQTAVKLAKYNRGFSHLMLVAFPVIAALWLSKHRWLIAPFLILLLIPASLTESRSSKLALVIGLAVIAAAHAAPLLVQRLMAAGTLITITWPFAARELFLKYPGLLPRIPPSWRARMEIWDYMSYRIQERPWLGWGLGTSHTLPFAQPHGAQYVFVSVPAAHPHNVMTQLWVELGLPGLALGLAFAFLTLGKAGKFDPRLVPFTLGAWAAALCLSLMAYDFWTDSLWAAFAMTALAFLILQRQLTLRPSSGAPEAPR